MGSIDQGLKVALDQALREGRTALFETEGMEILRALGIEVPRFVRLAGSAEAPRLDLSVFPGEKVVVKAVSAEILHKSDVGAVAIVRKDAETIRGAIAEMEKKLAGRGRVAGYSVSEFVPYDGALGGELLVGVRQMADFGPVVSLGAGGIYTEFLAAQLKSGREIAILSPEVCAPGDDAAIDRALAELAVTKLTTQSLRGQKPRLGLAELRKVLARFLALARSPAFARIAEFEVNPLVIAKDGRLVALDALAKLADPQATFAGPSSSSAGPKPLQKIRKLLEPQSLALIGVSTGESDRPSPGRVILGNTLKDGFDPRRIYIVKPGAPADGSQKIATESGEVACYPDVASLPERVDLCVLSIPAAHVPGTVTQVVEAEKAESLIVIPGGLEEKAGTEALTSKMRETLAQARASRWQGPVINGGNCLGIRSRPGRYNTLFIPEHKLPLGAGKEAPVALLSQSGAFAISRLNKITGVNPRYTATLGNQMDLTIGDYLDYLKDDREVKVFAVYVEGFRPLDGQKFLKAARAIAESGRTVILYRAGRTAEGAQASASHTASIAGDFAVTRELCRQAGVIVAESIADFEDLLKLFTFLRDKQVGGTRLGALSNAGFECVAIADNLGGLKLEPFGKESSARFAAVFERARISQIVDVHNPLDLTPMTGDAAYEEVARAMLESAEVDVGLVACVPLTPALQTLEKGEGHREDVLAAGGVAPRLVELARETRKPWVAVIDAGEIYDEMARVLERGGVPVFREADRALRLFALYCAAKLGA